MDESEGRRINLNQKLILAASLSKPGVNIDGRHLLAPSETCISLM